MRECIGAALALTVLGAVVFAPHVRSGGFYSDDWATAATYRFAPAPRYRDAARTQRAILGARPVLAYAQPLPHAAFGRRPGLHIALAVALGVAVALAFYALLRALSIPWLPALAIAGLSLVFPWADSVRLWPIAGLNQLALLLWLGGAVVALRGLGGRAVRHVPALALYAAALLTYEAVGGLVLATGLLYLVSRRTAPRAALARWAADAAVAVALLAWSRHETGQARDLSSPSDLLDDLPTFAGQALELTGLAVVPIGGAALVAALLVAGTGALLAARGRLADPAVRRWLAVAGVAAIGTVAAFAPFVGSGLHPLDEGLNNRGNMAAALPIAALAYATLALAALALAPTRSREASSPETAPPDARSREASSPETAPPDARSREASSPETAPLDARSREAAAPKLSRPGVDTAAVVAAVFAAALGGAYAYRVRGDVVRWDRAASGQERILDRLGRALPELPPRAVVYAHGQPLVVSPGVSIFSQPWDLGSAVRLRYGDPTLNALPLAEGAAIACGRAGMHPVAALGPWGTLQGGYGPRHGAPYGRAILFDAAAGTATAPRNAGECARAARTLTLAPFAGDPR